MSELEKFRQFVLTDPSLVEDLAAFTGRRDLTARLIALSVERGYQFTSADFEEAMRSGSGTPEHSVLAPDKFRDWVPVRLSTKESLSLVEWCYLGKERFTDPFFEDTIRRRMRLPFNQLFRSQTSIESLGEASEQDSTIAPTGFIFHMSRCGSTLVARMLGALRTNIVISEAPPVDSIIRADAPEDDRRRWLKWMIKTLGRRRNSDERNYFLKFDSWNIFDLDFIREVFPDVPWIFLYRNPVEVIVSHMRQRGLQMIPGGPMESLLPDVALTQALEMPAEEYCARILGRFCSSALKHAADKNALLINYDQLPDAVAHAIAAHFRICFTADEVRQMNGAARFNAKTPQMTFEPDSERKRTEATDNARRAAATWVDPIYQQLEDRRLSCVQ